MRYPDTPSVIPLQPTCYGLLWLFVLGNHNQTILVSAFKFARCSNDFIVHGPANHLD